jgi:hypothetical protein
MRFSWRLKEVRDAKNVDCLLRKPRQWVEPVKECDHVFNTQESLRGEAAQDLKGPYPAIEDTELRILFLPC